MTSWQGWVSFLYTTAPPANSHHFCLCMELWDYKIILFSLQKFPELKFKYVEEEQPEEFFIPYVWSLVYNSAVGLYWNPQDIQLFTMDSD